MLPIQDLDCSASLAFQMTFGAETLDLCTFHHFWKILIFFFKFYLSCKIKTFLFRPVYRNCSNLILLCDFAIRCEVPYRTRRLVLFSRELTKRLDRPLNGHTYPVLCLFCGVQTARIKHTTRSDLSATHTCPAKISDHNGLHQTICGRQSAAAASALCWHYLEAASNLFAH